MRGFLEPRLVRLGEGIRNRPAPGPSTPRLVLTLREINLSPFPGSRSVSSDPLARAIGRQLGQLVGGETGPDADEFVAIKWDGLTAYGRPQNRFVRRRVLGHVKGEEGLVPIVTEALRMVFIQRPK